MYMHTDWILPTEDIQGFMRNASGKALRGNLDTKGRHTKHVPMYGCCYGLRRPNEGINQRNLKYLADVADKICFGRTYKFGIGI